MSRIRETYQKILNEDENTERYPDYVQQSFKQLESKFKNRANIDIGTNFAAGGSSAVITLSFKRDVAELSKDDFSFVSKLPNMAGSEIYTTQGKLYITIKFK